jgi:hypothetical protein
MVWERAGISPFAKELVVEFDPLSNQGKMVPAPRLSEKVSLKKLKGLPLFEIGAAMDGSNTEAKVRKPLAIGFSDGKRNLALNHETSFIKALSMLCPIFGFRIFIFSYFSSLPHFL